MLEYVRIQLSQRHLITTVRKYIVFRSKIMTKLHTRIKHYCVFIYAYKSIAFIPSRDGQLVTHMWLATVFPVAHRSFQEKSLNPTFLLNHIKCK